MYRAYGRADGDESLVIPPWFQQPQDELPVLLPVGEFLARTDGTAISVSHVEVYSTGTVIHATVVLRRRDESDRDWSWMMHGGFGRRERTGDELRWGVTLADGSAAEVGDHPSWHDRPVGWRLGWANGTGGGGGTDDRYELHQGLWLWPLPPAGPVEFTVEWRERGIAESRVTLDGDAFLAAVSRVRPLWPEA